MKINFLILESLKNNDSYHDLAVEHQISHHDTLYEEDFNSETTNDTFGATNDEIPANHDPHIDNSDIANDRNVHHEDVNLRRSIRTRNAPTYLNDYQTNLAMHKSNYLINSYVSLARLSPHFKQVVLSLDTNIEPENYRIAAQQEKWKRAMQEELEALKQNATWSILPLPPNKIAIGYKWVYKTKYNADGSVNRYKALLVAKGYDQLEGLDYFETFSPVAKITTIRVLLSLAAMNNWHLKQCE